MYARLPQSNKESMFGRDIIVIGASAGGVDALPRLIGSLPADLPAAVFVCPECMGRCGKQRLDRPSSSAVMWGMPIRPTVFSRIMRMAWSEPCGPPSERSMNGPPCCAGSESENITPSPLGHTGKPSPKNLNSTPR